VVRLKRLLVLLLFLSLSACASMRVPEYRGPHSAHYDGYQFNNLEPRPDKSFWTVLTWRARRRPASWPRWIPMPPGSLPPPHVEADRVRLTFINHATVLVQTHHINLLTDPVWSRRVGPTSWLGALRHHAPGVRLEDLPPLHGVLVSHNHYDHLDLPTLVRLRAKGDPTVMAGLGNRAFLAAHNLPHSVDLDWWQSHTLHAAVHVIFVPAQHWSFRGPGNRRQTLWGGFVIRTPQAQIYYTGDTGWGEHLHLVRQRLGAMDVCLLPIGAYLPRDFMRDNHLDPEEAVLAHSVLGCTASLGIHFGTFRQGDESWDQPPKDLATALAKHQISPGSFRTLQPGEGWEIPIPASGSTGVRPYR
jgi:L-ascorbate metabolism protein UlaG (beta-lactamase superfamily)